MGGAARRASAAAAAALAAAVVCAGVAAAAVYEVGDKAGWTIMGNPNYTAWAYSKKIHIRDTVVFTYNKQFHNVMAVGKADYENCNATKPTATWSTGNDSIVLNTTGHHYFLCGFPSHCAGGQKVDIRVASSAAPSESPAPEPAPGSPGSKPSGAGAAPSPHANAAPRTVAGRLVAATLAASVLSLAAALLG